MRGNMVLNWAVMIPRRAWWLSVLALLIACSHPPQGSDDVPPGPLASVRIPDKDLWSGGEVTVISSSFKQSANLPTVQVAGGLRQVRRVNDSTIAAQLPDTNAILPVRVLADSFIPFDDSITVHGFQAASDGPVMAGFLQVLPGSFSVIGAGAVGLIEVNLRTNTISRQFPDSVHSSWCVGGIGSSSRQGDYVFRGRNANGTCGSPRVWQYGSTPVVVDSVVGLDPTSPVTSVGELGVGGGFFATQNFLHVKPPGLPGFGITFTHSVFGSTLLPSKRKLFLHSASGGEVLNADTGDSLYNITAPSLPTNSLTGVAFSVSEDTVYAAEGVFSGTGGVVMAATATGGLLRSVVFPDLNVGGIARDPAYGWLYVLAFDSRDVPRILVLRESSLIQVAALVAPATTSLSMTRYQQFRVVPDPASGRVFVVATFQDQGSATQSVSKILSFGIRGP